MLNLKPCPFCGGEKVGVATEHDADGFGMFKFIACKACGASSRRHFVSSGNECPQFYGQVRDSWNRRPVDDAEAQQEETKKDRYPLQSLGCQKIKGNCLCHRCHPDVKNLMSYCSGTYIAHGKPVKQSAIYQTLRESGNTHEPAEIIARIDQLIATKIVQKNEMYFTVALESAISALDNNAPMPTAKQGSNAVNWGDDDDG